MNRQAQIHISGTIAKPESTRSQPKHVALVDKGCKCQGIRIPSCLNCPLPRCQYDGPESEK